MQWNEASCT